MIAAVALLSFAYFSIIELIAFSYAISGWSFSISAIQRERKPFQRLPTREKNPMCLSLLAFGSWLSALSRFLREPRAESLMVLAASVSPSPHVRLHLAQRIPEPSALRASCRYSS